MKCLINIYLVMSLLAVIGLSGCTGFTALPLSSLTTSPSGSSSTSDQVCNDPQLILAFTQSYWPFLKNTCVSCHGSGVTNRAFASADVSEAFGSFQSASTGAFKADRINANAVNPLHGSPATNGPANTGAVQEASRKWKQLAQEICARSTAGSDGTPTSQPSGTQVTAPKGTAVAIVDQRNILATYKTLTGVEPSDSTKKKIYDDGRIFKGIRASRRYLLPPTAHPSGYSSGTLNVSLVTAGEHCSDLVNAESRLAPQARAFFQAIDLDAPNMNSITPSAIDAVSLTLAKKFWRRSISAPESQTLRDAAAEFRAQGVSARQGLMLLCTLGLASVSSNVR